MAASMPAMTDLRPRPFRRSNPFASGALVESDHAERVQVESFISNVYQERYGARLRSFLPHLLAYRDAEGELVAAVGLRFGAEGALFTEQYLDVPAEHALGQRLGMAVRRHDLVEVGNFAAATPGSARELILQMTQTLHRADVRWVLFAATRQLRNAFDRLHLATVELAEARAERLQHDASDWGSYYAAQPRLMCGDVAAGHAYLASASARSHTPVVFRQRFADGAAGLACA